MKRFISTIIIVLAFTAAHAQVYTWINEEGVRVYGDEPPQQADQATLPELQGYSSPQPQSQPNQDEQDENLAEQEAAFRYKKIIIISPKEDDMITAGSAGDTTVMVHVEPGLRPGHEITLLHNGKPVQTAASLQFEMNNLNRGSHLIHVEIKHQGTRLISSPKRRFHVQRPSILNRNRTQ